MSKFPIMPVRKESARTFSEPMGLATDQAEPAFRLETAAPPVYGEFFGLSESPFNLTPDPRFLFLTAKLREALSNIRYGLSHSRGLTLVLGDAGLGKTTLVRSAIDQLPSETTRCVLMSNPTLDRAEFYEFLAREFGFSRHAARSKTQFLAELDADLRQRAAIGGVTGLIVDEAQSMPHELLEELRLLGNIETPTTKLLNIILCGQPELAARLNDPSLRQLKQRIALRCELAPLTAEEVVTYIAGRLRIAGGVPEEIFSSEAVRAIFEASKGIPRSINVIVENSLLSGYASQTIPVTAQVVAEVCHDFDFGQDEPASSVQPRLAADVPAQTIHQRSESARPQRSLFGSVYEKKARFSFFW